MATSVPTISSATAGPLGVIHLPRLWSKLLLNAAGKLPEGYASCGKGFDQMVLDALGLDREQVIAYVEKNKPTYPKFESWVKDHAKNLDSATIQKLNDSIRAYNHRDETRKGILDACGVADEGKILDGVSLNNLEDWNDFHAQVTGA